MKKYVYAFSLLAAVCATSAQARPVCRKSAVNAAKLAAPSPYTSLYDVNPFNETPDFISYEVTLADRLSEPTTTTTIEVTLAKATCAIIEDPIQK